LQLGHVVAAEHRGTPIQEAVPKTETGLDQRVPGLSTTDAVNPESAKPLEGLDRRPCGRPEDAVGIDRSAGQNGGQAVLDVGYRVTAMSEGQRKRYR
jgi:hypothetical protein